MTAFSVDPVAMHRLAQRIRQAAALAGTPDPGALRPAVTALSAPCLVHAVGTFIDRWAVVLADLADDTHRLADALDLTARSYQHADAMAERAMLR